MYISLWLDTDIHTRLKNSLEFYLHILLYTNLLGPHSDVALFA